MRLNDRNLFSARALRFAPSIVHGVVPLCASFCLWAWAVPWEFLLCCLAARNLYKGLGGLGGMKAGQVAALQRGPPGSRGAPPVASFVSPPPGDEPRSVAGTVREGRTGTELTPNIATGDVLC